MRPVRLELEGFTAFRAPTVVELGDADLFALVGPTGAGKSSLIDAICFALYGSVPRLDRRTVDPVVSTGRVQARVRLDFTVGATPYTAVRVVRRLARGGATTKEARLESGDRTIAGDADAVTAAVTELLGLGFQQFTTCVVLPQGDFARFLHDKPRDRQDLLVRLLELGVYDHMRERAGHRRARAEAAREAAARELEALAHVTPAALAAARGRQERLQALRDRLDRAQPRRDALAAEARAAQEEAAMAVAATVLLDAVAVPAELGEVAAQAQAAQARMAAAQARVAAAEAAADRARAARAALPDAGPLETARRLHAEIATDRARMARGAPVLAATRRDEEAAAARVVAAEAAVARAGAALEDARRAHAAAHVAAALAVGAPCPVCTQPVTRLPARTSPPALAEAERALADAQRARTDAAAVHTRLVRERATAEETMRGLEEAVAAREAALAELPGGSAREVGALLEWIAAAETEREAAEAAARSARQEAAAARDGLAAASARRDRARGAFAAARDQVAALGPPPVSGTDVAADWAALAAWAGQEARARRSGAAAAADRADRAAAVAAALDAELAGACAAEGLAAGDRRRDACADALAAQAAEAGRIAADLDRAERLRGDIARDGERAAVAGTLARHLGATGFERWLLDEALAGLVDAASTTLRELSGGQYSLAVDAQRAFAVVDHREADERRPARTLSGGETFLASLALALALADQVAQLAVGREARLESIFLDEGFGTLDPATLDTVAAALEELGARGRTVGLVTHVRDLAERMPVRYEVRRAAAGATVHRVDR